MKKYFLLAGVALALAAGAAIAGAEIGPSGRPSGAEMLMSADANKDGVITQDEQKAARAKRFDELDSNKDGYLTKDELATGWKKMHKDGKMRGEGRENWRKRGGDMLQAADSNQDGKISKTEFIEKAGARFDKMDANKDGYLDKSDREAREKQCEDGQTKQCGPFAMLDVNKDGKISRDEFINGPQPMFGRLDINKDGALDQKELESTPHGGMRKQEGPPSGQ